MAVDAVAVVGPENNEVQSADPCAAFATELYGKVAEQARRRQVIEQRWYEDTRQYYGFYDEETEKRLEDEKGSSKLFVNLTRPKTRVMRARLNDILFPNDEPNWDIQATPVPEIEELAARTQEVPPDQPVGPDRQEAVGIEQQAIEQAKAIRQEARKRADQMRMEVADQLEQSGYAEIGRKVIDQACLLGTGVAKGPFADWRQRQQWGLDAEEWKIEREGDPRPAFEWVDAWNFFPDMNAASMEDAEFVFELHRMSRKALQRLAGRRGFLADPIRQLLKEDPEPGEFSDYTKCLRAISDQGEEGAEGRYNVFEYHGPIPAETLEVLCRKYDKGDILDTVDMSADPLSGIEGVIWFSQDRILRFGIHHLDSEEPVYSIFRLDPQATGLGGDGIPTMMRDPQAALNAAWRMTIENGSLSGVPMFILDRGAIRPADGDWSIRPRKVWYRDVETERPAIEAVKLDGSTQELSRIIEMARSFSDDETNLPLIAQGDQGAHVTQTAHGMSLLVNAVNIVFRNAARGFDAEFTIPNIRRLYNWNMQFSPKDEIKGDMQVSARGSSVLLVRELQAQNLLMILNLAATNPLLGKLIRVPALARRLFQALQLSKDEAVLTEEEIKQLDQEEAGRPDPETELKLQLEQMKLDNALRVVEMQMQTEVLRLATQQEMSVEKIAADLEKVRVQMQSKERLMAAEIAHKDRHGSGL